jgi:hypothetical protein
MSSRLQILAGVVLLALMAAACGGDGATFGAPGTNSPGNATATSGGVAGSGDESASALITVNGVEYGIDTQWGSCDTESEGAPTFTDLKVFGYEVESGRNSSLVFDRRPAEHTPSGKEEFNARLSIGGDSGGPSWRTVSFEPWPWLEGDRSTVTGSVTMETPDGSESVEVTFEVSCP